MTIATQSWSYPAPSTGGITSPAREGTVSIEDLTQLLDCFRNAKNRNTRTHCANLTLLGAPLAIFYEDFSGRISYVPKA